MTSAERHPPRERTRTRRGPVDWVVGRVISVLWMAVFGLVLTLVLEWVGLTFWWAEEGAGHAKRMRDTELSFLTRDFDRPLLPCTTWACPLETRPADIAVRAATTVYRYSGVEWLTRTVATLHAGTPVTVALPPGTDAQLRHALAQNATTWITRAGSELREGFSPVLVYLEASAYITQLYGVRLSIVALSLGAFVLFGVVALVSGLVQRDLRRFGGGVESAWVFHRLTPLLGPCVWLSVLIYLSTPVSLHPNTIFVPAAAAFALVITKTTARFKKFL